MWGDSKSHVDWASSSFQLLSKRSQTLCTTWLARCVNASADDNENMEESFTGRS
jgi:hypothetical protein